MNRPGNPGDPPVGANVGASGVTYRVWAPDHAEMSVLVEAVGGVRQIPLSGTGNGYWAARDPAGRAGDRYRFQFADGRLRPDVASRFQPEGVHGPSECIDPADYPWNCRSWVRPVWSGQTIYELHVGALTSGGTYRAAAATLDRIRDLGVEAIELMPVADFAGNRNWGYDGVALYAPARCYGRPDDLRALVDAAHERALAVILDVVYNHLGPSGNYAADYCADYFHADRPNPWGLPFNVDGKRSRAVRDFLVGNAAYWLDEFRFDGLRLDATHAIPDGSAPNLLAEIASAVHARGGFVIAEDERNEETVVRPFAQGGFGMDGVWADDFHHQVRVALTGTRESYFRAYSGTPADMQSTLAHGWTYRGQAYAPWGRRARGSACDHLPATAFVFCIENHDQVGNGANGDRLEHQVAGREFRAASLLLCLSPYVPLIFMGQEWAASSPFLFFTDHGGELGGRISAGRRHELEQQGRRWADGAYPDPEAPATFIRSKLHWRERSQSPHAGVLALYREALRERLRWLRGRTLDRACWTVQQLGDSVAIRYQVSDGERLLVVTLGSGGAAGRPLPGSLEPPAGRRWQAVLHSEESRFGGDLDLREPGAGLTDGPAAVWLQTTREEPNHATP